MIGCFPVVTLTIKAAATIAANRFVLATGALPTAGGPAHAVSRVAAVSGDLMPCDALGTAIVEAGGVIAVGGPVKVAATGKVLAHDSTNTKVGVALGAAAADGDLIEVLLIPNG